VQRRRTPLGSRIAQLRKERGLTQKELAERLAVTQPVVSDYENDVIRIPADVVVAISKILTVSTDELLGLKPEVRSAGGVKNRRLSRRLHAIDGAAKARSGGAAAHHRRLHLQVRLTSGRI
jgi:transcriptional regulator with XRE-family HTH domain